MTKFHTKFRPGDLVRDKRTNDEGVVVTAKAIWYDKHGMISHRGCTERKEQGSTFHKGIYGIFPKTPYGSLNGSWYEDKQIELAKKGFLH